MMANPNDSTIVWADPTFKEMERWHADKCPDLYLTSNKVLLNEKKEKDSFPVHSSILKEYPHFNSLLETLSIDPASSNMNEMYEIEFEQEPEVLEQIINYLYHGRVSINPKFPHIEKLFKAADKFQLAALREKCFDLLTEYINEKNWLPLLKLAGQDSTLLDKVYFALGTANNLVFCLTPTFFRLEKDELKLMLTSEINPFGIHSKRDAIMRWAVHNDPQGIHLNELLEMAGTTSPKKKRGIKKVVTSTPTTANDSSNIHFSPPSSQISPAISPIPRKSPRINKLVSICQTQLDNVLTPPLTDNDKLKTNSDEKDPKMKASVSPPKAPAEKRVSESSSSDNSQNSNKKVRFEKEKSTPERSLYALPKTETFFLTSFITKTTQMIFVAQHRGVPALFSYNFVKNSFRKVSDLAQPEIENSVLAYANSRLFCLGGNMNVPSTNDSTSNTTNVSNVVSSIGMADLAKRGNNWRVEPRLCSPRQDFCTIFLGNQLYLIGGTNDDSISNSIEFLDLHEVPCSEWHDNEEHMEYYRESFGIAFAKNKIYMIGGIGSLLEDGDYAPVVSLSSVETFDLTTRVHEIIAPLKKARAGVRAVSFGKKIYAIGGGNKSKELKLSSIEVFDPKTGTWTDGPSMNQKRCNGSAFVLEGKIYAVGGNDGEPTIEYLDPNESQPKWKLMNKVKKFPEGSNLTNIALVKNV